MLEHVPENKEVVVNAPTLICQEFCRTRREGETREEKRKEELLSHTSEAGTRYTTTRTCDTPVHTGRTTRFERFLAPGRRPAKTA